MKKETLSQLIALTFSILVICFLLAFYAFGWTGPSQNPPQGNVPPPLNAGPVGQEKIGGLIIATGEGIVNGLIVDKGNVGIGTREPQTPAPNGRNSNLDVNDVYLRSTGKWASQLGGARGICVRARWQEEDHEKRVWGKWQCGDIGTVITLSHPGEDGNGKDYFIDRLKLKLY